MVVVELEGLLQIIRLRLKVKIELITPTLHAEEQMPVVGLLTVEIIEVVLQIKVVLQVMVPFEVPVHVEQAEAPKSVLEMMNTHQETGSLGNPLWILLSIALPRPI